MRGRKQSYASPTVREGGRLLTAREGFKEGAGASGTPSCCTLQEAVAVAESLGAVTEPHGPQEKVRVLDAGGRWGLGAAARRRAGQPGLQRRRLVLDAAAKRQGDSRCKA